MRGNHLLYQRPGVGTFIGRFALVAAAVLCLFFGASEARADAGIGEAAPAFVAKTLDGKAFDLSAQKGKVVILNFWATWCPPCRWEMPALEAVWRQYRTKGLEVLAVSADIARARQAVVDVMHYFSFPAATMDAVSKNELLTVKTVPVTFLIGKDGKVADMYSMPMRPLIAAELDAKVKTLLDAPYEAEKKETDKKKEPKEKDSADDKDEGKPDDKDAKPEEKK